MPVASLDEVGATMRAAIEERAAEDAAAAAEAEKDADYSGKFVLRLPRSMHRQLAELAEAEGVSLNQLALAFLAQGMGRTDATQEFGERRGPRGGHRGPAGMARGGRGRHGGRGRKVADRGVRGPSRDAVSVTDTRATAVRTSGPVVAGTGFGGVWGGGRPDFAGFERAARPVDPETPRLV